MKTYRLQAEMTDSQMQEFDELVTASGLSTKKELLSNALMLFRWAVKERQAGRAVCSMDDSTGKIRELGMPALDNAALRRSTAQVAAGG